MPWMIPQYPYVTGTSVLALKYKDGVLMACDTLGSYGSTKRYKSVERMKVRDRSL
jgi:20S proteasome subunit beta 7